MALDELMAKDIARLARLRLTDSEDTPLAEAAEKTLETLVQEFAKIVQYMDILGQADTSGVEPLYSPMLDPLPPRYDEPSNEPNSSDAILDSAPERIGRFFSVPRIF
jgi:aspartyl-tRNA(Asn)/glutamyl-tRNA(Gln) amidotransferase subunit C